MRKKALLALWDPPEGVSKTVANYAYIKGRPNAGDLVFCAAGARLTVGRHFDDWNFLPITPEEVNERYSKLVLFLPCRIISPELDAGWYYDRVTEFIQALKIPVISASESIFIKDYDYAPDLHRRLSPQVVRYLRTVGDKCARVGTRGAYSAEVLHQLGIKNAEPIGCPSFFYHGPHLPAGLLPPRTFANVRRVAVGYTNYQLNRQSLIRDVLKLAAQNDYYYIEQQFTIVPKLLYWPGFVRHDDLSQAHQVYLGLEQIQELFARRRVRYFTSFKLWLQFLQGMDFVFGSRLHGNIMAINAGVPAYFIVQDARVREICEYCRLPHASEEEVRRKGLDVRRFVEAADYTETVRRYPALYAKFVDYLRANDLADNLDPEGNIVDPVVPDPDPTVLDELDAEATLFSEAKLDLIDVLFKLGDKVVRDGLSPKLVGAIADCSQLIYDADRLLR